MTKPPARVQVWEVKFFLDPDRVLAADGGSTPEVATALKITGSPEAYRVGFFDGPHLDFHTERWNVRFRDKGGRREVSYKRRLPVYHDSVAGVVDTARRQGFDAQEQDEGYEAEIEWGPERQTLSLVKDVKLDGSWPATDAGAAAAAADKMSGKLRKWMRDGWAESVLADGRLFGPVAARRWKWGAVGGKTAFEVWDVLAGSGHGTERVAEVSFKAAKEAEAGVSRETLRSLVAGPGWLLRRDLLKTDLVLDRYRKRDDQKGQPAA